MTTAPSPSPSTSSPVTVAPTATAVVVPAPPPASTTPTVPATPGGLISVFLTGAVIAAVVGAVVNVALARRKAIEEERARVRTTFAEAFQAVAAYKEFPYAIRRRRHDEPEAERVRLSEALREVQAKLSYYLMWTKAESDDVGQAYETLVTELRKIAGKACHDAWLAPPAHNDKDMNFQPGVVDLSGLKPYEEAFTSASTQHLKEMRSLRRLLRRA